MSPGEKFGYSDPGLSRSQFRLHTIPYKTNRPTRCFTVRLAGPINTDTRGKISLNAFKTAYKKQLISFYH